VGGALAPVADHRPGISGWIGSGVCGSRMTCLGPGREGKEITSGRRDAQGLTFSVVIPVRDLQPGVSTRGKQNWPIALCCYGMTLAQRHRVHRLCVASLAHLHCSQLRCMHRLGCSLAGLWWRVRVGMAPGPTLRNRPCGQRRKVTAVPGLAGRHEGLGPRLWLQLWRKAPCTREHQ
jgi:hypothetical protein